MIRQIHNKYINSKLGKQKGSTKFVYLIFIGLIAWFAFGMFFAPQKVF